MPNKPTDRAKLYTVEQKDFCPHIYEAVWLTKWQIHLCEQCHKKVHETDKSDCGLISCQMSEDNESVSVQIRQGCPVCGYIELASALFKRLNPPNPLYCSEHGG